MLQNPIISLEKLRKNHKPIRNVNVEHREKLGTLDRLAVVITEHVGTMGFFLLILFWTVTWLAWNILAPLPFRFDPYPAFVLWLFISNMIQIFLMPLLMVGQNLQGKHSEARADADFEINTQAEKEIETIIVHLEHQNELLSEILQQVKK